MKRRAFVIVLLASLFTAGCGVVGWGCGFYGNALKTAKQELYPEVLLQKYSWFKDAAASLDKKTADIDIYTARLRTIREEYGPANKWPRDVREQAAIWGSELAGIKASYNSLAAEYNSQMSKLQWRFTNVGDMPDGGKPLPREYRIYISE